MLFDMYCDESYQDLLVTPPNENELNQPKYTLFGGLKLPQNKRELLKEEIKRIRKKHDVYSEFKWQNVSNNKLAFYIDLVDLFFSFSQLHFKVTLINSTEVDHEKYNQSDHELGYYKFYYMLIKNWIKDNTTQYYIFLDEKTNKNPDRLHDLKRIINRSLYRDAVVIIQEINSEESDILQLQNIIMGAVAYKFNQPLGTSNAKNSLIIHIEKKLNKEIAETIWSERKFNVFFPRLEQRSQ